jgi:hypothetical protein
MLSEAKHLGLFAEAAMQKYDQRFFDFAQNDIYEMTRLIRSARCFEQEPRASLGFIDPNFD